MLALYVAALAAVGLHDRAHAHRVCEHGDLVHAEVLHVETCDTLAAQLSSTGQQTRGATLVTPSAGEFAESLAHAHEHCAVALPVVCEQRAACLLAARVEAPREFVPELRAASRHPSSEPLYLLAPSQSPPVS